MVNVAGLNGTADEVAGGGFLPLFLLSFRQRDELAALIRKSGRSVVAARRPDMIERRFIGSGAAIAVVDARGAPREGLAACEALSLPIASTGSALLVLISQGDLAVLDRFIEAGVTHYLISPFGQDALVNMLRMTDRFVERVAGGGKSASERARLRLAETEAWTWRPGDRSVQLSSAFAERIGLAERDVHIWRLLAGIDKAGRRAANEALSKLLANGRAGAFAHGVGGRGERLAHHIHFDDDRGVVIGWVEGSRGEGEVPAGPSDPLTGLANADTVRAFLAERLTNGEGPEPRATLMLLGISRFGLVNAAFGRVAGDAVLQGVAKRIERIMGQAGQERVLIARTAGSEFAIAIGSSLAPEKAELIAQRLVDAVCRPFVSAERLIPLSCRVGVAAAEPDRSEPVASLFQRAGAALAAAKHGDQGVHMLDASQEAESHRRSQLEIDLRRALHDREIDVLFQPQVKIGTGEIVGVEALARWRHPTLGELGAETLFDAAARSDYVTQLSAHVQRRALELAARWPLGLSHLRLSLNVTASDITSPNFVAEFLARVDAVGFPRQRLTVEVTESGLIEDLSNAAVILSDLRGAGLRVAIDDFGTGYSSLAYLKALPLDYLKIDKALAADISGSTRDRIVVRGVIDMARSLGLAVVAEGVETTAQLGLLAREGCNYYQGFLCSRAVDSEALIGLLQGERSEASPAA
ncbi:putative bifunctional diguanylate cyclase/phosphodiesterase [Sphingomonas crocodyli]|uniref:putative bifunctional diguanylate cyclase/phosphodiesterase n=1 Tax=Sphingomonas crocodyli TaxID=1979270 RepID=UPI001F0C7BA6|nr:bifunctional diguanylate cyclase/phosphodiesterase [Sphingomonas crocodyli]